MDASMIDEKWREEYARIRPWTLETLRTVNEPQTTEFGKKWQQEVRANLADSAALDEELAAIGMPFTLNELKSLRQPYPEAVPVLLRHLELPHRPAIVDTIFQALAIRHGGNGILTALFDYLNHNRDRMRDTSLFALGVAIAEVAEKGDADILVLIASERVNGDARLEPLLKLGTWKDAHTLDLGLAFLERNELPWFAIRALRRAKAWTAARAAQPFLDDENVDVRSEARKFIDLAKRHQ
jgi:hypothetical protein